MWLTCAPCHHKARSGLLLADKVQAQQSAQTPGLTRTELHRIEYAGNYVIVQMYVEIKAGVEFPRHTHPSVASALVLDGEIVLNVEGEERTYRRTERFQTPAGKAHWGRGGASDCRVFATFVVEKDKSLASRA